MIFKRRDCKGFITDLPKCTNGSYKSSNYDEITLQKNNTNNDIDSYPIIRSKNQLDHLKSLNSNITPFNNIIQKQIDILEKEAKLLEPRENLNIQSTINIQDEHEGKIKNTRKKTDIIPNRLS